MRLGEYITLFNETYKELKNILLSKDSIKFDKYIEQITNSANESSPSAIKLGSIDL